MEPYRPQSRQGAKVFHSCSLSLRPISLWLNRYQVQGFGELSYTGSDLPLDCPRKLSVSRIKTGN
jgi:hypothetical protein